MVVIIILRIYIFWKDLLQKNIDINLFLKIQYVNFNNEVCIWLNLDK